jgi:GTP-binding protein
MWIRGSLIQCSSFSFLTLHSVGIHQRPGDLEVNVCKMKQLTNMRSATKGITTGIAATIEMSLDQCVEYLAADEILEVTATKLRMAKNPAMAKKASKK